MKAVQEKPEESGRPENAQRHNLRTKTLGPTNDKELSASTEIREREILNLRKKIQDMEEQYAAERDSMKKQLEEAMKKRLVSERK